MPHVYGVLALPGKDMIVAMLRDTNGGTLVAAIAADDQHAPTLVPLAGCMEVEDGTITRAGRLRELSCNQRQVRGTDEGIQSSVGPYNAAPYYREHEVSLHGRFWIDFRQARVHEMNPDVWPPSRSEGIGAVAIDQNSYGVVLMYWLERQKWASLCAFPPNPERGAATGGKCLTFRADELPSDMREEVNNKPVQPAPSAEVRWAAADSALMQRRQAWLAKYVNLGEGMGVYVRTPVDDTRGYGRRDRNLECGKTGCALNAANGPVETLAGAQSGAALRSRSRTSERRPEGLMA